MAKRKRKTATCHQCQKTKGIVGKGLCSACYQRNRYHDTTLDVREKQLSRWEKIRNDPELKAAYQKRVKEYESLPHVKARRAKSNKRKNVQKYGISFEFYQEEIKNGCNICGSTERLHIDHCHTTNKYRGILCHHCNTGIGLFKEDLTILDKAKEYLTGGLSE